MTLKEALTALLARKAEEETNAEAAVAQAKFEVRLPASVWHSMRLMASHRPRKREREGHR